MCALPHRPIERFKYGRERRQTSEGREVRGDEVGGGQGEEEEDATHDRGRMLPVRSSHCLGMYTPLCPPPSSISRSTRRTPPSASLTPTPSASARANASPESWLMRLTELESQRRNVLEFLARPSSLEQLASFRYEYIHNPPCDYESCFERRMSTILAHEKLIGVFPAMHWSGEAR